MIVTFRLSNEPEDLVQVVFNRLCRWKGQVCIRQKLYDVDKVIADEQVRSFEDICVLTKLGTELPVSLHGPLNEIEELAPRDAKSSTVPLVPGTNARANVLVILQHG
ncbi:hypothetical protein LEN26_013514 [Aphanomyces euteiches]|nr:hypothetical protein LEN26_013514 [Aphanomyces euteiches]